MRTFLPFRYWRSIGYWLFPVRGVPGVHRVAEGRMADTAAHLGDRVFPIAPVRQWVLSVPFALRYRMAYDKFPSATSTIFRSQLRLVMTPLLFVDDQNLP